MFMLNPLKIMYTLKLKIHIYKVCSKRMIGCSHGGSGLLMSIIIVIV
jgi:hypothetical protein